MSDSTSTSTSTSNGKIRPQSALDATIESIHQFLQKGSPTVRQAATENSDPQALFFSSTSLREELRRCLNPCNVRVDADKVRQRVDSLLPAERERYNVMFNGLCSSVCEDRVKVRAGTWRPTVTVTFLQDEESSHGDAGWTEIGAELHSEDIPHAPRDSDQHQCQLEGFIAAQVKAEMQMEALIASLRGDELDKCVVHCIQSTPQWIEHQSREEEQIRRMEEDHFSTVKGAKDLLRAAASCCNSEVMMDSFNRLQRELVQHDTKCCQVDGCGKMFGWVVRPHHCRRCGLCVCNSCSLHQGHKPSEGSVGASRLCDACYEQCRDAASVILSAATEQVDDIVLRDGRKYFVPLEDSLRSGTAVAQQAHRAAETAVAMVEACTMTAAEMLKECAKFVIRRTLALSSPLAVEERAV